MPVKQLCNEVLNLAKNIGQILDSYDAEYPNDLNPEKAELVEQMDWILGRTEEAWKRYQVSLSRWKQYPYSLSKCEALYDNTFTLIRKSVDELNSAVKTWHKKVLQNKQLREILKKTPLTAQLLTTVILIQRKEKEAKQRLEKNTASTEPVLNQQKENSTCGLK